MFFLQTDGVTQKGTEMLFQYGVLGLFAIIMIIVIIILWKRINKLEENQSMYLREDRKEMLSVINKNTSAFEKFEAVLENMNR